MKRLLLGLPLLTALAMLCASSDATAQPAADAPTAANASLNFVTEKYTLPNGLEVILHEAHHTPVVAVNLWYHVGSRDEAPGKSGFAHLFEHMMFQGSRNVAPGLFLQYLDSVGATDRNATTNTDRTSYFETVPRGRLDLALWLESDRMAFLLDRVDQKVFDNEREVVKNERRERYENAPYGLVPQFIRAAVFPQGHPYRNLSIGSTADLNAATLDDVRSFFKTYYVPNNATLVIAGDFEPAWAKELVERYFGPIPRGAALSRVVHQRPVQLEREVRLEVEANVELPRLYLSWPSPALFAKDDAELSALSRVLAHGKSSRLYERLVHDTGLAQQVGVRQASAELGGIFEIVVSLKPGGSPDKVLRVIDEELARLRSEEPSNDELVRAKARLVTSTVFANERVSHRANSFNAYNQLAGDPAYVSRDLARYQAISGASIRAAVQAHLGAGRVITVVTPSGSAPSAGALRTSR